MLSNDLTPKIVLFDIDGTLMQTNRADAFCFRHCLKAIYRLENFSTDWSAYRYSTDWGILEEIVETNLNRAYCDEDDRLYRSHYLAEIAALRIRQSEMFLPTPGAEQIFGYLEKHGWTVGIATGAFRESAEFKLRAGNLLTDDRVLVTADDHRDRAGIIAEGIKKLAPNGKAASIVYVGDGSWDLKAAEKLGIHFVGINADRDLAADRFPGSVSTFDSFENVQLFLDALEKKSEKKIA